jgi:hypothetical protein
MLRALRRLDRSPTARTAADLMWNSASPLVRQTAPAALLAIGGELARAELRKAIGKRNRAEDCYLDLLTFEGPVAELAARLKKSGAGHRAKAAELLLIRGDAAAVPALRAALRKESDERARAAEAAALLRLAGKGALDDAHGVLPGLGLRDRIRLGGELTRLGTASGFEALGQGLRSPNRYLRFEAARRLAECGNPGVEKLLLVALGDKSQWPRRAAIAGLGRLGGRGSLKALRGVARRDPRADLRSEARWAVAEIRKRLRAARARRHK